MLLANGFAIPQRIATALVYGIQTDTADLARNASPVDEEVFTRLYPLADLKLLGRIQRARVPQEYFKVLERGLRHALVHGNAVTTHLGEIEHPDLVAEVADLLFRLEGMTWSFVTGSHARVLYASIRAVEQDGIDAGRRGAGRRRAPRAPAAATSRWPPRRSRSRPATTPRRPTRRPSRGSSRSRT